MNVIKSPFLQKQKHRLLNQTQWSCARDNIQKGEESWIRYHLWSSTCLSLLVVSSTEVKIWLWFSWEILRERLKKEEVFFCVLFFIFREIVAHSKITKMKGLLCTASGVRQIKYNRIRISFCSKWYKSNIEDSSHQALAISIKLDIKLCFQIGENTYDYDFPSSPLLLSEFIHCAGP